MAPSRFLATASLIACCGCSGVSPVTPRNQGGPTGGPGPASRPPIVHEGRVLKWVPRGDMQPVPNLALQAWDPVQDRARVGASRLPDVTTDESGRFRIMANSTVIFLEIAPGSAFTFICPSLPHYGELNDVHVFDPPWSGEWSSGNQPTNLIRGAWGKVLERVGGAVQPVPGATVTLDDGSRDPPSTSNANGVYSICSVNTPDTFRTITARKAGYRPLVRTILWGWDEYDLTLMLERN